MAGFRVLFLVLVGSSQKIPSLHGVSAGQAPEVYAAAAVTGASSPRPPPVGSFLRNPTM